MGNTINLRVLLSGVGLCLLSSYLLIGMIYIPRVNAFEVDYVIYTLSIVVLVELFRKTYLCEWKEILASIILVVVSIGFIDLILLPYLDYKIYLGTRAFAGIVVLIIFCMGSFLGLFSEIKISNKLLLYVLYLCVLVGITAIVVDIFQSLETGINSSVVILLKQEMKIWIIPYIFLLFLWKKWKNYGDSNRIN